MKFSIIIPVLNVEPYLKKCLDSVVNQTLLPMIKTKLNNPKEKLIKELKVLISNLY